MYIYRKGINFRGGFNFAIFVGYCFNTKFNFYSTHAQSRDLNKACK